MISVTGNQNKATTKVPIIISTFSSASAVLKLLDSIHIEDIKDKKEIAK